MRIKRGRIDCRSCREELLGELEKYQRKVYKIYMGKTNFLILIADINLEIKICNWTSQPPYGKLGLK